MSKLSLPLRELLRDTTPTPAEVEELWAVQRERRAPRRRARWLALPAAAAVAALLLVWWQRGGVPPEGPQGPLLLAGGQAVAVLDADAPRVVAFQDGSRVELEAGAALQPLQNRDGEVDFLLRTGRVRFQVDAGARRWSVDAGVVLLQTGGARFAVWRGREGVEVIVSEGEVVLRGERVPGRVMRLGAGASVRITGDGGGAAPAKPVESAATDRGDDGTAPAVPSAGGRLGKGGRPGPAATDRGEERPAVVTGAGREESRDAAASEGAAAGAATPDAGSPPPPAETLDDLLRRADAARLAGRPAEALPILDRAAREFAGDRRAAVVAYTRGRICADDLRDPRAAAASFALALRLGLPVALEETAYLRLVETRKASKDAAGAAAAAREHQRRYPNGRERARIDALLGAP